jgi:hypothetical protein
MKRVKITLISLAIFTALTTAYATKECQACVYYQQYILVNNGFVPAGNDGTDYICWDQSGVCTWYKPSNNYVPCKTGTYLPLH